MHTKCPGYKEVDLIPGRSHRVTDAPLAYVHAMSLTERRFALPVWWGIASSERPDFHHFAVFAPDECSLKLPKGTDANPSLPKHVVSCELELGLTEARPGCIRVRLFLPLVRG